MAHPMEQFRFCPKCGSAHFAVNDGKSKRCADCGFVLYDNAAAAVACFVVRGDELLLCTRAKSPAKGTLDLPGGFADHGETAEEALAREVREELNLRVVASRYLFSLPNVYAYSGFDVHTLDLFYMAEVADFAALRCADDVAHAEFYPISRIDTRQIGLQSVRQAVEKFISEDLYRNMCL